MKINMSEKNKSKNSGFTIIELMIATSVFSIVLVVAASGILTIGRTYYKSLTSSRAQEAARSISNTIAETIKYNAQTSNDDETTDTVGVPQAVCFGYDRYSYIINSQVGSGAIGLMYDRRAELNACSPIASGGTELVPDNMRLLHFDISSVHSDTFRVNVKVAYGENDLFDPDLSTSGLNLEQVQNASCRPGIAGSSFCSISELETTINKRVE